MKIFIPLFLFVFVLLLGNCQEKSSTASGSKVSNEKEYLQKGKTITAATFATLSGNLQKAMQEGGVQNALNYCNLAAMPLVDSLSKVYDAAIRRTALKVRNPKNNPSPSELKQLEIYQTAHDAGETLQPTVQEIDPNTVAFYAPIKMMPLCEKCHGAVGASVDESDYALVKKLYPKDEAINFATGDLRGMWSIQFKR